MPPKQKKPAASKAAARAPGSRFRARQAKATAKAKAGKPEAAGKGKAKPKEGVTKEKGRRKAPALISGVKELDKTALRLDEIVSGETLVLEGHYWEGPAVVAGKGQGLEVQEGGKYLRLKVEGTSSDSLLQFLATSNSKELLAHLCEDPCGARVWRDGLMRLDRLAICPEKRKEDWMSNCKDTPFREGQDEPGDDLALLRREAEEAEKTRKEKRRKEKSRTPNREKEDKKKKKKKSRSGTPSREEGEKKKKKSKKEGNKKEIKVKANKELALVLGQTGLDPSPEVRRVMLKRARRLVEGKKKKEEKEKKSKKASSGTDDEDESGSSTTSMAEGEQGLDRGEIFQTTSTVRRIANEVPGAPMAREYLTVAYMVDLILQARAAEAADMGVQRLKSLMATSSGVHYSVAQKMELIPPEKTAAASLQETIDASKEAREEQKVMSKASQNPGWQRSYQEAPKGGKGKDGKGKKGKNKDGKGRDGDKGGGGEAQKK